MAEESRGLEEEREPTLTQEQREYAEDLGIFFERFGLPRAVGRVLAVLLVRPGEHSAEELASLLGASRGAMSQATRAVVEWGLVRRGSRPGERRDYFSIRPGAWGRAIDREVEMLATMRRIAERGMTLSEAEENENLQEMRDFFSYMEGEMPGLVERWQAKKRNEE